MDFSVLDLLKYILLGIVQGITEVLPISSSGHVAIAQTLFSIDTDQGMLFLIVVNVGSLVAIVIHFRKTIGRLIVGFVRYVIRPADRALYASEFHYCMKIALASIPLGLIGLTLKSRIETVYAEFPMIIVGLGLLATATALYLVRNASYHNGRQEVTYRDATYIGLAQMFAILPGLSRSGSTTSSALGRKLSMETALIFSFMIYIPASIGSSLYYGLEIAADPTTLGFDPGDVHQYLYYAVALAASLIATRFSLKFIFRLFRAGKLVYFSVYTFVLGMVAFIAGLMTF
ncbi:MAG: undecaprenyl-diphosphate phosphatase [Candidatus Izemoplasmatales bacterium]